MSACPFVWYDLMTTDIDAAEKFYADVVGWRMRDSGMAHQRYTLLMDGEQMAGGIMAIPADAAAAGVPPAWMGYVGVADLSAKAAELEKAGGAVHRGPQDIPGVGRFCVVSDPQGAGFILFEQLPGAAGEPAPFMAHRTIGWRELNATDMDMVWPFYEKLFGWKRVEAHDMGGFTYMTFATGGADPSGGMMTMMPGTPQPYWAYYISVEGIDSAVSRARAGGGSALMDVMEVPGGMFVAPMLDPQGAHFNLIGPRG
jgi:predicted enzyme related to lactoylglutathione lyase